MGFRIITECTSCNERKVCNEIPTEYNGTQRVLNFCKECNDEIDDILSWANNWRKANE